MSRHGEQHFDYLIIRTTFTERLIKLKTTVEAGSVCVLYGQSDTPVNIKIEKKRIPYGVHDTYYRAGDSTYPLKTRVIP